MSGELRIVLGDDEYLADRRAAALFAEWTAGEGETADAEVIDGRAQTVDEARACVRRFAEATRTGSLFGGGKAVWLRQVNFLGEGRVGQSAGGKEAAEELRALLEEIAPDPPERVLLSGAPLDKRRAFAKWVTARPEAEIIDTRKSGATPFYRLVEEECQAAGVSIEPPAIETLLGKLNGELRMANEEIRKLITALPEGATEITEDQVLREVPEFGETEFFEAAEVFFRGDLAATLEAIRRHFFSHRDAGRPLLTNLLNRNRLMIQLRVLFDAGRLRVSGRRIDPDSLAATAEWAGAWYGQTEKKNPVNLFAQNPFYLGNLAAAAQRFRLRQLIDFQGAFLEAFRDLVDRPHDQEAVFRELAVRCLGPTAPA